MSFRNELRVEDVLTGCAVLALLATGASLPSAGEGQWWEYSFIVFPATLVILGVSVRYALGDGGTATEALGRIGRVVRDWMPFALFLAFYETAGSRLFASGAVHEKDAALLAIDRMLFGDTPSVSMQSWISPGLTAVMAFCYFVHLLLPPLVAFFWYRRDLLAFRHLLLTVFLCGAFGVASYLAIPAVGPAVAYPDLYSVPLRGTAAMEALTMMDAARAPHDVFPSLHIAISAVVLWFAWKYGRRMFLILLPLVAGNWLSTLYLRYHYGIDVVAGFVLVPIAILSSALLLQLERRWRRAASFTP